MDATAATAAGPGFPRAPPSTWTTTFTRLGRRLDLREGALGTLAATVLEGVVVARVAALGAPVDDHLDVRVVPVVVRQPVVQLVRKRLRHHAVDHSSEPPSV